MPKLVLLQSGREVHRIDLDTFSGGARPEVVLVEDGVYGFMIEEREPATSYALWTGDVPLETGDQSDSLNQGISVGKGFGSMAVWQDSRYFDGARGHVQVKLSSRKEDEELGQWSQRVVWPIYVVSTKTTEESYAAMCEELRRLASGLLFDIISKSTRGLSVGQREDRSVWHYSSQLELLLLEKLWEQLSGALDLIFLEPWKQLSAVTRTRACYGGEKFAPREVLALAAQGLDPRRASTQKPFRAARAVIEEGVDTLEHQIIAGFLHFLLERIHGCEINILRHMEAIEEDRPYRQLSVSSAVSLYESIDVPRIRKLHEARARAKGLVGQISDALTADCLKRVIPRFSCADTPVFRNVETYYRASTLMSQFLNAALVVLDEGNEERLKSTHKLYEQWVFVQLAAAFRTAGLTCVSREGMLNQVRRYRYTLDIDRGASLTFLAENGWYIVIRYEPWILPETVARQRRDTVYRESRSYAWSPDVLIEFCIPKASGTGTKVPSVEYAIVIDAKYARAIREHHRSRVEKYLDIRSTASRRQIVRQVWIAAPSTELRDEISMWDPSVDWTSDGPSCGKDEQVGGLLVMIPDTAPSEVTESGWLAEPIDAALRFVRGLLRYVGVEQTGQQ